MTNTEVLEKFFEARDVIHYAHLNTQSYAVHKALGSFYEGWTDLMDSFIETYQGKYGRVEGIISVSAVNDMPVEKYFEALRSFVLGIDIYSAEDKDLDNIAADMIGLINRTLYKLTLQ